MKVQATLLCFILLISSVTNACWTEYNFRGMVQDARKLTPKNLQWVLDNYQDSFQKGLQYNSGTLTNRDEYIQLIVKDSQVAVQAFTADMSYVQGAEYLGRLARTIAEMHTVFRTDASLSNPDWATDYAIFLQKKRSFFRIRWKGTESRPKDRASFETMLQSSNQRVDQVSKILTETLNRENKPISSYDVRSAPFGVGSIAYSNAVNTIALTWLYIWDQAGGIK